MTKMISIFGLLFISSTAFAQTMVTAMGASDVQSIPKDIGLAPSAIQNLGLAVAKVARADGASGSGFFISSDGVFITNEHVIPRAACTINGCPGIKILLGFTKSGQPRVFSKFKVIAQDNSTKDYDFTVIKVELKPGETVPYLELETDEAAYKFTSNTNTEVDRYIALGHPGGASLQFASARPIQKKNINIEFQGLVIGGNSGGPLVDVQTGKVIGLDKNTRTAFIKLNNKTATTNTKNQATAIRDLLILLKTEVPNELTSIKSIQLVQAPASKTGLFLPSQKIIIPAPDIFSGAMRRTLSDPKLRPALAALDLYIGTTKEISVLDLMLRQDEYTPGPIQVDALVELFHKQLLLGRPLKFSPTTKAQIETAIVLQAGDETTSKITANILFNYFNFTKRKELQQKCILAFPDVPMLASAIIYNCVSSEGRNGTKLIPQIVEAFSAGTYNEIDDFGPITGFLMAVSIIGTQDPTDLQSIVSLDRFVTNKLNDIESLMLNDSFAMNIVKGIVGVGSFADTFTNL